MPYFQGQLTTATALANGNAILSIVPAAAANFKLISVSLGVNTGATAISDFDVTVGLNRATARGTQSGASPVAGIRADPNSSGSQITGLDVAWTVQPTLAASDFYIWSFNTRGGIIQNFNQWDIMSTVGTANPIVFVQRSGANLPTGHAITIGVEWLE